MLHPAVQRRLASLHSHVCAAEPRHHPTTQPQQAQGVGGGAAAGAAAGSGEEVLRVNWRDVTPNIAHQTAIVWPCISPAPDGGGVEWDAAGELTKWPTFSPPDSPAAA